MSYSNTRKRGPAQSRNPESQNPETREPGRKPKPPHIPNRESVEPLGAGVHDEVRAGPGDAGAQHAPRVLDDPGDTPSTGWGRFWALVAAGLAVLLVMILASVF